LLQGVTRLGADLLFFRDVQHDLNAL
jgi:hypothetical protein